MKYKQQRAKQCRWLMLLLILSAFQLRGQHLPLNHGLSQTYLPLLQKRGTSLHTSFKPLMLQEVDSANAILQRTFHWNRSSAENKSWFIRKLRYESLLKTDKPGLKIQFNPLLNVEGSLDPTTDSTFFINTRGFEIKGRVGQMLTFYSSFRENQAYFPRYINNYVHGHVVVPGQGVRKSFGPDDEGHDFAQASGYLAFQPFRFLRIRFGHHKHFIGEGYRSLLLSDNTSNYPFLALHGKWRGWHYRWILAELQDFTGKYYDYHYRKLAGFYYLSYKPFNWLETGIFQAVKWNTSDRTTSRKVPAMFFSPLIFSQAAVYGLNGNHNVLAGFQVSADITQHLQVYGQLAVDELAERPLKKLSAFGNQLAAQAGMQHFNLLDTKNHWHQLAVRLEYNMARPYTYAHQERFMAYTQLNQPLAHPLGTGFHEMLGSVHYRFRNICLKLRYRHAFTSKDTVENMHSGENIFKPDAQALVPSATKTSVGQGLGNTIQQVDAKLSYLINPAYNFHVFAAVSLRKETYSGMQPETVLWKLGLRTALNNYYFDF